MSQDQGDTHDRPAKGTFSRCPFCGAARIVVSESSVGACYERWACGSVHDYHASTSLTQSAECKQRAASSVIDRPGDGTVPSTPRASSLPICDRDCSRCPIDHPSEPPLQAVCRIWTADPSNVIGTPSE